MSEFGQKNNGHSHDRRSGGYKGSQQRSGQLRRGGHQGKPRNDRFNDGNSGESRGYRRNNRDAKPHERDFKRDGQPRPRRGEERHGGKPRNHSSGDAQKRHTGYSEQGNRGRFTERGRGDRDRGPVGPHARTVRDERPKKGPAPELPEGVSHKDVSGAVRQELKPLSREHAETVAAHLAAAGALLDTDPEEAYVHAKYAVDQAGRIAATREALGLVAYRLERYAEAIKELRTHRRITGTNDYIPVIADSERGRGKPKKALEMFREANKNDFNEDTWIEFVIVAAGAHVDRGDVHKAKGLLEAQGFTGHKPGPAVRLLAAYADVLRETGDEDAGNKYEELARLTAHNAGLLYGDEEIDPNEGISIYTVEEEPEEVADGGVELSDDAPDDSSHEEPALDTTPADSSSTHTEQPHATATQPTDNQQELNQPETVLTADSDNQAEPVAQPVNKPRTLQEEIEAETDEILREAGIDPKDLAP